MKVDQSARNDERCREWCADLETLRQNPGFLSKLGVPFTSEDLKFRVDTAVPPPPALLLAAMQFELNLKTAGGIFLLMFILADVLFRPELPAKKGRPSGTKKWDQRKLARLGLQAAIIKDKNPGISDHEIARKLCEYPEYRTITDDTLRQVIPDARQAHEGMWTTLPVAKLNTP